jgi:formylglycine-generating enzyme required for sulfatase activity
LCTVVDLLLDLADENSAGGWKAIGSSQKNGHYASDLQKALVVRWDQHHPGRLLVSSPQKDPGEEKSKRQKIGTIEAIRRCLEATESAAPKRKLNLSGRRADTSEEKYATEQIRNALYDLASLNLRKETEKRPPGALRSNDKHYSFWIIFPPGAAERKRDCLAFIEKQWNEPRLPSEGEEAHQKGNSAESLEQAETKQRLDQLDRWIQANLNSWRQRFEMRDEVRDRRIHVPLSTAITLATASTAKDGMSPEIRELRPEDIQAVVADKGSQMLMIWEEGGAGKTSLAFQIARWGLEGKLADHPLFPILLDPSPGPRDLVERVKEQLSHVDRTIDADAVRDLLTHRRLLVIVDHFSECTMPQRQWLLEQCRPQNLDLVLLTSRQNEGSHFAGWLISTIQPQRLQGQALFLFFKNYLAERTKQDAVSQSTAFLLAPDDQVRTRELLERMVGNKPITVLLVWMVIEKAIAHIQAGRVDLLPSSVPELMLDYVERSSKAIPPENQVLEGVHDSALDSDSVESSLKALALAAHEQNEAYKPQNFGLDLAQRALAGLRHPEATRQGFSRPRALLRYLDHKLNLLQRQGGSDARPIYRFSLDPLADYLAALALIDALTAGHPPADQPRRLQGWLDQRSGELERSDPERLRLMGGFLSACRDVCKDRLTRLSPDIDPGVRKQWHDIPLRFAQLAGIDPLEERQLEARHLIRRHAGDLAWANPELRPKALDGLSAYAREFAGVGQLAELEEAVGPLTYTLQKSAVPVPDRAAAAETLGLIGSQKAVEALERMINNDHESSLAVRRAAAAALGLIQPSADDPDRQWDLLECTLRAEALNNETNPDRIAAVLPLLQGASRGLQRLASRRLPLWGSAEGRIVPMLSLTIRAGALTTAVLPIPVWQVLLPDGRPLELVQVPKDTYEIGSPETEVGREEVYGGMDGVRNAALVEARRTATFPTGFLLARYPITQAQWSSLADSRYRIQWDLTADPAQHKGADRPVECVSWYDACEWCARLQRHLEQGLPGSSLRVRLPNESEWEAACRAGSSGAFHFGDTILPSWANYDGNDVYPGGCKGTYLNRTSEVGAYGLVNSFGLSDLHGNVWEWCEDIWHPSPLDGPRDGSAQLAPAVGLNEKRLLRGGSWVHTPHRCRAALRYGRRPRHPSFTVGFRPGCFAPPGSLLGA